MAMREFMKQGGRRRTAASIVPDSRLDFLRRVESRKAESAEKTRKGAMMMIPAKVDSIGSDLNLGLGPPQVDSFEDSPSQLLSAPKVYTGKRRNQTNQMMEITNKISQVRNR